MIEALESALIRLRIRSTQVATHMEQNVFSLGANWDAARVRHGIKSCRLRRTLGDPCGSNDGVHGSDGG